MARARKPKTPFYRVNSSPDIIRLVMMMYAKYPLSLRNVEDLLHEREIDVCHETVRFWWNPVRSHVRCGDPQEADPRPDAQPNWLSGNPSGPEPGRGRGLCA